MNPITKCPDCSSMAIRLHVGFAGQDELYCTQRHEFVSKDDGCTFGSLGKPMIYVDSPDVYLGGHATAGERGW